MLKEISGLKDIVRECTRAQSESKRLLFFLMLAYANTGIKSDPKVVSELVRHGMRIDDDMDRNNGNNMLQLLRDAEVVFRGFGSSQLQSHAIHFLTNYAHIEALQRKIPSDQWTMEGLKTYREAAALPWAYVLTASTDSTIPLPPPFDKMPSVLDARNQYLALPTHFSTDKQRRCFYGSFGLMMQVQVMGDMQGRNWNMEHMNPAFGVKAFGDNWESKCLRLLGDYSEIASMGGSGLIPQLVSMTYPTFAKYQHKLPGWGDPMSDP